MTLFKRVALVLLLALCLTQVTGCFNRPVRHLASDASLIQKGETTAKELRTLLGEPDSRRALGDGREEWLYHEETPARFEGMPYAERFFKSPGHQRILVIVSGEQVIDCRYESRDSREEGWRDDFDWQRAGGE